MKIKWTNRWSGDTGYVLRIESDHFVNTFDKSEGKNFRTRREAEKAVEQLFDCGEGLNNDFEVVINK